MTPFRFLTRLMIATLLATLMTSAGGCTSSQPRPIAMDPSEPVSRLQALDTLMDINNANAAALRTTVTELRRLDRVCVILATGIEVRPGVIIDFEDGMLSAELSEDFIDVRVINMKEDPGVYAASGCPLTSLTWNDNAPAGWGVFETEAQARRYLDSVATALTTLGGSVARRVRHDNE